MLGNLGKIGLFVGAVWAAEIIIHYTWRAFSPHVADNPATQGLAATIS